MKLQPSKRKVLSAFVVSAALVAASCGGSTTDADEGGTNQSETASGDESASGDETASSDESGSATGFPTTEVVSLADGQEISFNETVADTDTPILLWFYLPH